MLQSRKNSTAIGNNTILFLLFQSFPQTTSGFRTGSGVYPTRPSSTIVKLRTPARAPDGPVGLAHRPLNQRSLVSSDVLRNPLQFDGLPHFSYATRDNS